MITVTRFDHSEFILNADLIEFIESKPDTHITLITGKKLLVCETASEIVTRVIEFRRQIGGFPHASLAGLHAGENAAENE